MYGLPAPLFLMSHKKYNVAPRNADEEIRVIKSTDADRDSAHHVPFAAEVTTIQFHPIALKRCSSTEIMKNKIINIRKIPAGKNW